MALICNLSDQSDTRLEEQKGFRNKCYRDVNVIILMVLETQECKRVDPGAPRCLT